MPDIRHTELKFALLPTHVRTGIAQKLGIAEASDIGTLPTIVCVRILDRAKAAGLMEEMGRLVQAAAEHENIDVFVNVASPES